MNGKLFDIVSSVLFVSISVQDIQSILSIIIIVFQVLYIIGFRIVYPVIKKIKENKFNEVGSIIKDGIEDLENIKESVEDSKQEDKEVIDNDKK